VHRVVVELVAGHEHLGERAQRVTVAIAVTGIAIAITGIAITIAGIAS
jgi:hypothetical protein